MPSANKSRTKATSPQSHFHDLKDRLEGSFGELLKHAKKADKQLSEVRDRIRKMDKAEAKAALGQISMAGVAEINKLKARIQDELQRLTGEVKKSSERFKTESSKVREKAEETLETVKKQIKSIAQAERTKRKK